MRFDMLGKIFLGRYETQKLLGEGGMGKVYLAKQLDLGRPVVVKVMHEHVAQDAKFLDRFQRETLLMANFAHPNAVTLYDASLTDPLGPCIVMEYVKGENLEKLLKKNGKLSPGRVARILAQLCDVLGAAHEEGIIHRDLKPANIMIVEPETPKERVKVMDFGLAKMVEDGRDHRVTDTTIDFAVGTPGYICPEQVRGEAMDHRGDLYSVGVMVYELLTGRLPFLGANSMDVLLAHATEDPPPFADIGVEGVPQSVEQTVRWMLEKEPSARPQSAKELYTRFTESLESQPRHAPASQPIELKPVSLVPEAPKLGVSETTRPMVESHNSSSQPPGSTALTFQMEAYMPETIALMKLRGYVHDIGGQILKSDPGLIRLRMHARPNSSGALTSWLGITRRADGPIDLELHFHRNDAARNGHQSIDVIFRPSHASLMSDEAWKKRCSRLFIQLRGFLMS